MYINYKKILKEAIPIKADCYICDLKWSGKSSRDEALRHRDEFNHPVWIESIPIPDINNVEI